MMPSTSPSPILQRILKLMVSGVFVCLLSGCGLKGPLYLPLPPPAPAGAPSTNQPPISEYPAEEGEISPLDTDASPQ